MCRVFSCIVGRGCLLTSSFSWQNSASLCPSSFCTPRPNLSVTTGITTRRVFCLFVCLFWFGLFLLWLSLFFLEIFLHSMLRTYQPGKFIFQCHIFLPFHDVHGILKGRTLKWFAIPFSSGLCFVRTLHHDSSILGGPTGHGL